MTATAPDASPPSPEIHPDEAPFAWAAEHMGGGVVLGAVAGGLFASGAMVGIVVGLLLASIHG